MNTNLKKDIILDKIGNIFNTRFNIEPKLASQDYSTENLLGSKYCLNSRDLVYLFFEVEKEFQIHISQDDICNGSFNTIQGIVDTILKYKKESA